MKSSATFAYLVIVSLLSLAVEATPANTLGRRGNQFVTGPCTRDSDCQQGCCAFNTGKCAGPGIAQTRDGGCGFGNAKPNCNVAAALNLNTCARGATSNGVNDPQVQAAAKFVSKLDGIPLPVAHAGAPKKPAPSPKKPAASSNKPAASSGKPAASSKKPGNASGFVTSPCKQDSDCQQGCCAFNTGKCAGPGIAQTRDGGCGFGDAKPNCNVAAALKLNTCARGASSRDTTSPQVQAAAKFVSKLDGIPFTPA
ncbi:hypothetical protein BD410DRAFT_161076 [Rickenella mellea]|uniref:Biotrophy-associated secreted protein 2 n=1 Tax=Rickenella mellea TaxID=50990 RepID=A0A4Y7Q7B9_9AGAM|nr:hypothetical protein BD410DRAFT_161076 [Rickenella mellea]